MSGREVFVIVCSDMNVMDELFSRLANTLEGIYVFKDDRIPILIIKSENVQLMNKIRNFLVVLSFYEKIFIQRMMWLEEKDLVER